MTVLRTNVPIYFNAVNLFKCQFSKDPLKFLTDEMVSSFQQGRIPDIEYFIYQNWRTLPICVLTDTCCRHLNILNWWTSGPGHRGDGERDQIQTAIKHVTFLVFISFILFSFIISSRSNVSSKESGFCFFSSGTGLLTITCTHTIIEAIFHIKHMLRPLTTVQAEKML